jgi:RNA polymerase sigma-70 factor (ECF subfamily)
MMLLEKLSPAQRAAYVLVEAFDYSCRQIADILQMEEANVRQLVSRARKHIAADRRSPVSSEKQQRLLEAFIGAAEKGNMSGLEGFFAEDVVSNPDRSEARVSTSGRKPVATFDAPVTSHFWKRVTPHWIETNGQASLQRNSQAIGA